MQPPCPASSRDAPRCFAQRLRAVRERLVGPRVDLDDEAVGADGRRGLGERGDQVAPAFPPVQGDVLDFNDVLTRFEKMMDWLAGVYVNAMNVIHYMHDKYAYERVEMALHDYAPLRTMAFGMAGLSVIADSLSAIKYAKVRVVRDKTGLVTDYKVEGDLRREVQLNIKRLMDLGCYRGLRHRRGLPVNGQRTHTNARTRKGPRKGILSRGGPRKPTT